MFAEFVYRVLQDQRNSDLQGCSGNWIKGFYDPVGNPQIKEIVNRIDNIKNLVFADTFINGAKKYSVAHKYKQVGEKGLDTWTPESRQETVNGIRALAVFPTYMNDNAAAFRSTVGDIIAILQKYDRRMGSLQSPPLAVQFHQRVQSELTWYGSHAQSLATNLATKFAAKLAKYPALTCYSNFATLESDLNNNFPTLNTAALLPPAPLCFPDGSRGRLDFRPPPYSPGLGIVLGSLTIGSATANGNNIQVDITRPSGALMYPSVFPPSEPVAECVGIYHILPVISPPAPKIQLDFDCNTRELSIQGLANPRCVLFKIITTLPTTMQTQTSYEQLCGTSLQDTVACGVKFFPGSNVMEDNKMFWEAVPG
ncbi:hypothetical protein DFH09DRAFT_199224 [Mycena vulgaris]|nr:hypothetical protein DFH09DRAFT_199224 [Mycena vulgaris]